MLLACQQPSAPPTGAQPSGGLRESSSDGAAAQGRWAQMVELAKQEGRVNVYGALAAGRARAATIDGFEKAFPGVKVDGTFANPVDVLSRIIAEREGGKYIPDALIGLASSSVITLKPIGAVDPLVPIFVLPEITDTSAWQENRLWWLDGQEPLVTLGFQGSPQVTVAYNTQVVDVSEFSSYLDLLNPKWKGKMVSTDVRQLGGGGNQVWFMYRHPDLGRPFVQRLFTETEVTISADQRQMIDWVATGQYPIGLFLSDSGMALAVEQGLPISRVPAGRFKEGTPVGVGGGTINIMNQAPHPNAAAVYVNWLVSREGQLAWQAATGLASLRTDISKDGVPAENQLQPGIRYVNTTTEEFNNEADEVREFVSRALASVGR
ncbi:MAG: ABC-type Fe3+ transport system periplasmic component [Chloroflexi bacterium]|nr:ABC-type Fe3+ transport system periplasmic component [Chloroflexota bacterium]